MRIGFWELIVIFVVALLVIGPDKLPYYAKRLGQALQGFRDASNELTKDLRETVVEPLEEAQRPLREAMQPLTELTDEVNDNLRGLQKSVNDLGKPPKPIPKAAAAPAEPAERPAAEPAGEPAQAPAPAEEPAPPAPETPAPAETAAKAEETTTPSTQEV